MQTKSAETHHTLASDESFHVKTAPNRRAKRAGLVVGALLTLVGSLVARRMTLRAFRTVRFGYRIATFSLYRRCPDCASLVHRDARVCKHCGFRRAG